MYQPTPFRPASTPLPMTSGVFCSGLLPSLWTPRRWHTLDTGGSGAFSACLGTSGLPHPPFSAKKGGGKAEKAGNYPDWNDHAVPEEPCLALHWGGGWPQHKNYKNRNAGQRSRASLSPRNSGLSLAVPQIHPACPYRPIFASNSKQL